MLRTQRKQLSDQIIRFAIFIHGEAPDYTFNTE